MRVVSILNAVLALSLCALPWKVAGQDSHDNESGVISVTVAPPPQEETPKSGTISGNVVDPTGAAIYNAQITATEESTGKQYHTAADPSGSYRFPELAAGKYSVKFESRGFRTETKTSIVVTPDKVSQVDVRLMVGSGGGVEVTAVDPGTGTIAGAVTDLTGAGIWGAHITAVEASTGKHLEATTGCDGTYQISNLAAGDYTVRVEATGFRQETKASIRVTSFEVTRVDSKLQLGAYTDFEIQPGSKPVTGTIQGRVVDAVGAVIFGACITATEESTGRRSRAQTDPTGQYRFSELLVGKYSLKFEAHGFRTQTKASVIVSPGKASQLDVSLTVGPDRGLEVVVEPPIETSNLTPRARLPALWWMLRACRAQ